MKHKLIIERPEYIGLRLTIPAREALERAGNHCTLDPLTGRWAVRLTGTVPTSLVLVLIGQSDAQHRGLRLEIEPEYPGEWSDERGIAWHERGDWVPCPDCAAPLVWYEAGYVPGYRVCAGRAGHHALLSSDGRSAKVNLE